MRAFRISTPPPRGPVGALWIQEKYLKLAGTETSQTGPAASSSTPAPAHGAPLHMNPETWIHRFFKKPKTYGFLKKPMFFKTPMTPKLQNLNPSTPQPEPEATRDHKSQLRLATDSEGGKCPEHVPRHLPRAHSEFGALRFKDWGWGLKALGALQGRDEALDEFPEKTAMQAPVASKHPRGRGLRHV